MGKFVKGKDGKAETLKDSGVAYIQKSTTSSVRVSDTSNGDGIEPSIGDNLDPELHTITNTDGLNVGRIDLPKINVIGKMIIVRLSSDSTQSCYVYKNLKGVAGVPSNYVTLNSTRDIVLVSLGSEGWYALSEDR